MNRLLLIAAILAAVTSAAALSVASASGWRAAPTVTVATRQTALGRILTDGRGLTLYLFEKDTHGRSNCSGACATYWPPLLTRLKPTAGGGARRSLLGVIRRSDGLEQVTYGGHPLYRYLPDTKPGQVAGQDSQLFGAAWYVLSPSGAKIERGGS